MPKYNQYSLEQLKYMFLKKEEKDIQTKEQNKLFGEIRNPFNFSHIEEEKETQPPLQTFKSSTFLLRDLELLLNDESTMDVKINLKDDVVKAHKLILSMRSKVFKNAFYHEKKEEFDLKDIEVKIFQKLLHFIYTEIFNMDSIRDSFKLLDIANTLNIESLCTEIYKRFEMKEFSYQDSLDIMVCSFERNDEKRFESIINKQFYLNSFNNQEYLCQECVKWSFDFINHYMKKVDEWMNTNDKVPKVFYSTFSRPIALWAKSNLKTLEDKEKFIKRCLKSQLLKIQSDELIILNEILKENNEVFINELFEEIIKKFKSE